MLLINHCINKRGDVCARLGRGTIQSTVRWKENFNSILGAVSSRQEQEAAWLRYRSVPPPSAFAQSGGDEQQHDWFDTNGDGDDGGAEGCILCLFVWSGSALVIYLGVCNCEQDPVLRMFNQAGHGGG